jgi:hypothetical protein
MVERLRQRKAPLAERFRQPGPSRNVGGSAQHRDQGRARDIVILRRWDGRTMTKDACLPGAGAPNRVVEAEHCDF